VNLADAGYWQHGQIEQISAQGIPVLVRPTRQAQRHETRLGERYAFRCRELKSELGKALYRRRPELGEPVFERQGSVSKEGRLPGNRLHDR
jgi:hypothetical protein